MATAARELFALLGIEVDTKQLDSANKSVDSFVDKIKKAGVLLGTVFAAKRFADFIEGQIQAGTAILDMSRRLGLGTEELLAFQRMGQQVGVTAQEMAVGLRFLNRTIGEAELGSKQANKTFGLLGIQIKDANGKVKPSPVIFGELADAFAKIDGPAEKTALAIKIFGRQGIAMLPVLAQGRGALDAVSKSFTAVGAKVRNEFIANADKARISAGRLQFSMFTLKGQIASAVLPAFTKLSDLASKAVDKFIEFADRTRLLQATIAVFSVGALVLGISKLISLAGGLEPFFAIMGRFAWITGLIVLTIAAVDDLWVTLEGGDSVIKRTIDGLLGVGTTKLGVEALRDAFKDLWSYLTGTVGPDLVGVWYTVSKAIEHAVGLVEEYTGKLLNMVGANETGNALIAGGKATQANSSQADVLSFWDRLHSIGSNVLGPGAELAPKAVETAQARSESLAAGPRQSVFGPGASLGPSGGPVSVTVTQHIQGTSDPKRVGQESANRIGDAVKEADRRRTSRGVRTGP